MIIDRDAKRNDGEPIVTNGGSYRPLVIIVGWLGCHPKQLRRYKQMYSKMGFACYEVIPSPSTVANATFEQKSLSVPRAWPYFQTLPSSSKHFAMMETLAWNVLAEIDALNHPMVLFHVFSNAGCFFWEKVNEILRLAIIINTENNTNNSYDQSNVSSNKLSKPIEQRLQLLRYRIVGTIFDSCPGSQLHRLPEALRYCTWQQYARVMFFNMKYIFFDWPAVQKEVQNRSRQYMTYLMDDKWDLPQLYLYSENDTLAPHESIKEIVEGRQRLYGHERIFQRLWKESSHCAHFFHHPEQYQEAVQSFVNVCISYSLSQRSRL